LKLLQGLPPAAIQQAEITPMPAGIEADAR